MYYDCRDKEKTAEMRIIARAMVKTEKTLKEQTDSREIKVYSEVLANLRNQINTLYGMPKVREI